MSIVDFADCADGHLAHYVDPANGRAFFAYDRVGNPTILEPVDLLAPGLLDASVRGSLVIDMYRADGPYRHLRETMEALLDDPAAAEARFEDQNLDSSGPWALVLAVLKASDHTSGLKASMVTKILHRKRPRLVPIFDSKVAGFYGVTPHTPWRLWPIMQEELRGHGDWIRELAAAYRTPDDRELSALRALDIVVWEHTQGCSA